MRLKPVVLAVSLVVSGMACSRPGEAPGGASGTASQAVPPSPPRLAGTWNVVVSPAGYDGCGAKRQESAMQWLVSVEGNNLTIRMSSTSGDDSIAKAVLDGQRIVMITEQHITLDGPPPKDDFFGTSSNPSGTATWLLQTGSATLSGTRSTVLNLGDKRERGPCLVEQAVSAKRL